MKKLSKTLIAFAIIALGFQSNVNSQAVEAGNFNLTFQYGFPDLFKAVIKRTFDDPEFSDLKISGFGPIGVRAEYMVADKIGIGLLFNYTSTKIEYLEGSTYYDSTSMSFQATNYDYALKLTRMRILPRFSFHFGNSDKFDGYFGVAAGYYSAKLTFETNDPNVNEDEWENINNLVPFAMRVDIGGNYYFTDNVGLNFELGFGGGPLVNAGLALKF